MADTIWPVLDQKCFILVKNGTGNDPMADTGIGYRVVFGPIGSQILAFFCEILPIDPIADTIWPMVSAIGSFWYRISLKGQGLNPRRFFGILALFF